MAVETVVVGAGPAGLAVGAALQRRGVASTILEGGASAGWAWRHRYDSLQLHTIRWLSGLPGAPIPRRCGRWVGRDDLVSYLQDYAERFRLRLELGVEVTRIERREDGWRLETSRGSRSADVVVLATGYSRVPWLPEWPGRNGFRGDLLHSADYRQPSAYAGQHVLVVGAGNSAAEIAVELASADARVDLSVRTPPNIVRRDPAGIPSQLLGIALKRAPERLMNPLGTLVRRATVPDLTAYGLPAPSSDGFTQFLRSRTVPILDHGFVRAVETRRIGVVAAVDHFDDDGDVVLADRTVLRPAAVIAATGYRPALEPLVGHLGVLDATGMPLVHGIGTLPQAPGLYFVGVDVQLAGLLREIGLQASAVARAVARRQTRD